MTDTEIIVGGVAIVLLLLAWNLLLLGLILAMFVRAFKKYAREVDNHMRDRILLKHHLDHPIDPPTDHHLTTV